MKSSRVWSCSTLRDGVDDVVSKQKQLEEEELELQRQIQDWGNSCHVIYMHILYLI